MCPVSTVKYVPGTHPLRNGALGGIRTPDRLVRSQELYPTELPARRVAYYLCVTSGRQTLSDILLC